MQDVEAAEGLQPGCNGGRDAVAFGDVRAHEDRFAATVARLGVGGVDGRLARGLIDIGDHDLGSFLRKASRGRPADSAATARNQCHLPVEPVHAVVSPMLCWRGN